MSTFVSDSAIKKQATAWLARRDRGFELGEEAAFNQWRSSDPRHAEALSSLEAAWQLFDHPRTDGTSDLFRAELRTLARRQNRRRLIMGGTSLAAACLVMLFWRNPMRLIGSGLTESSAQVSQVPHQTLPDGSIVELRYGAAISVDYSGGLRRVVLQQGEAHFQVVNDADREFIVTVGQIEVRAVGTAFLVQRGQAEVEVVVTQGRVVVSSEVGDQRSEGRGPENEIGTTQQKSNNPSSVLRPPSSGMLLDAGHRVVVDIAAQAEMPPRVVSMSSEELTERVAWRLPRLEFTDTTMTEAVSLFNRNNRVQLQISDQELARLRVSGVFRSDNIDGFVDLLVTSFGVRATRSVDVIILAKAR